jgi:hypothetical protein
MMVNGSLVPRDRRRYPTELECTLDGQSVRINIRLHPADGTTTKA